MLPIFHDSFEALTVSEDVDAVDEGVVLPISEVNVSVGVEVHPKALPFMTDGVELAIVNAAIKVLLLYNRGLALKNCYKLD